MAPTPFTYPAIVLRWVDGDTCDVLLTVVPHPNLAQNARLRLLGVDTPERGQSGYREATARCVSLAPIGSRVLVQLVSVDSFGRYLSHVYAGEESIADVLLEEGYAVPYLK
ncbi:thermonuclease family protein [Rhodococcus sp. 11-3]|uniref:thermonuclease family protein n=1 Tax=Rhodococcus sp. 11-3 TaxID=2854796 RepID=UPI00203B1222|nr:thermonuclease family protein [Rhodococcus sp. 11-3]USC17047.1 thermonuclease family protein [Rhodococcus sp. 11-3]